MQIRIYTYYIHNEGLIGPSVFWKKKDRGGDFYKFTNL
jgi:hypothetical protein